jgi:hypothetical protein
MATESDVLFQVMAGASGNYARARYVPQLFLRSVPIFTNVGFRSKADMGVWTPQPCRLTTKLRLQRVVRPQNTIHEVKNLQSPGTHAENRGMRCASGSR